MTEFCSSSNLPQAAHLEFVTVSRADWQCSVMLPELLARVNRVAAALTGDGGHARSTSSRVKVIFSERSFRHYQTLGCIDVPDKRGRSASYGFRHFVQALLVRRLLAKRVSADQIDSLLSGCGTEELERMLVGGVEIVTRLGGVPSEENQSDSAPAPAESWSRMRVAPGVELHLSVDLPRFKPAELRRLLEVLEKALRKFRT